MQVYSPNYAEKKNADSAQRIKKPWRPRSLVKQVPAGGICDFCGAPVGVGDAICGSCGRSLIAGKCSFCGAAMKPNAKFCARCGQSREGVKCPNCGTLNSRNFCRKCNTALTPLALRAMEEARNDPKFQQLLDKAEELAVLHAMIEESESSEGSQLSESDRSLLDGYAELLSSLGSKPSIGEKPKQSPSLSTVKKQDDANPYHFNFVSVDDMMKAYHEKIDEMNKALAEIAPPPEYTPEQQRDYYAARKVITKTTEYDMSAYNPSLWKCNYCGCLHNSPPECVSPELGGTWIYVSPEEYIADNPHLASKTIFNIS